MKTVPNENPKSAMHHASRFTSRQRTFALVVVAAGFVMDLLDTTIVNTAIPSIQANLGMSYAGIQWVLAGYLMAFALLLITAGRMGDVFGYKKIFLLGVAGYALASLFSGIAWSPVVLIISRIAQGAMAALMVPQGTSTVQIMYKADERGQVLGLFGALGGIAAALGPVISGILIKANLFGLDWRPIFLINIPVAVLAIIFGLKYLPDGKSPHPLKLDFTGTLLAMVAMTLVVFPLIQGRELGWPAWTFVMMALSVPAFAAFGWDQVKKDRRGRSPLIVPKLFRKVSFSAGIGINGIFAAFMSGFFLTLMLFLQIGLGYSALHAALTGLPVSIGVAFIMSAFGKVLPRLGRKALISGSIISGVGYCLTTLTLHHYGISVHSWQLIPGLLLFGIGMGVVFSLAFTIILYEVDQRHAGSASGTMEALQQIGSAIGIAVIGVIFFGQLASGAASSFKSAEPQLRQNLTAEHLPLSAQNQVVAGTKTCFADIAKQKDSSKLPASCKPADATKSEVASATQKAVSQANAANFDKAFRWSTVLGLAWLVLVIILSLLLPRRLASNKSIKEPVA